MRVHSIPNTIRFTVLSLGAAMGLGVGCSGEKADPKTAGKADLNPPGLLDTVTKDGEIELRWSAGNVEDDFKGYYVFALKKSEYDLKAKGQAKFPTNANPLLAGIPRCADNSKWFEAFGLPATDATCEADKATPASGTAKLTDGSESSPSNGDAEAAEEKLKGFVKCKESTDAEPSLKATPPAVSTQVCTVNKMADGTALANGTTYVFFVVAVAKDDLSTVSWTSNLVSDTPSKGAVSDQITIKNNQSAALTIDVATGTVTLGPVSTCVVGACTALSELNKETVTVPTIHISRTSTASFRQRLYISAPQGGKVTLQPRGPQTYDPLPAPDGKKAARIPGDQAVPYSATTYPAAGTKFIVYNNQVFDFAVTEGTTSYYGKVVIGDVTYTNDDQEADAVINVSVILQTAPNVTDYLTSPE